MRILNEEFKGAADDTRGFADKTAQLNIALDELQTALGEAAIGLLDEADGLIAGLGQAIGLMDEGDTSVDLFTASINRLTQAVKSQDLRDGLSGLSLGAGLLAANPLLAALVAGGGTVSSSLIRDLLGEKATIDGAALGGANVGGGTEVEGDPVSTLGLNLAGAAGGVVEGRKGGKKGPTGPTDEDIEREAELISQSLIKQKITVDQLNIQTEQDALKRAELELELEIFDAKTANISAQEKALRIEKARQKFAKAQIEADKKVIAKGGVAGVLAGGKSSDTTSALDEIAKKQEDIARAGLQGAAGLAASIIDNEAAAASIKVLVETAEIASSIAKGNIAGAVAHGFAAAQWAIVAGKSAGGGGSAPAKATGGGAGIGAGSAQRRQGQEINDAGLAQSQAPIVINFSSVAKPTPEDARQIARAVGFEQGNKV